MDRYAKFVLTVIAGALVIIALKPFDPPAAQAALFSGSGPTWGDWMDAMQSHDKQKIDDVRRKLPMVYVKEGSVSVDNTVRVEGSVQIVR